MTETDFDLGVFKAHQDDLEIFSMLNRSVEATVAKLTETRQENMWLRSHRWGWFLAALLGWVASAVGWWAFWVATRI